MRQTYEEVPIKLREDSMLVEDICLELRKLAMCESRLPKGEEPLGHIDQIKAIHCEIVRRKIDITNRIDEISVQTSWKMKEYLAEALDFPNSIPLVRNHDGIRRQLRCMRCDKNEWPFLTSKRRFCDGCLNDFLDAIENHLLTLEDVKIVEGSCEQFECMHANPKEFLIFFDGDEDHFFCKHCITEEIQNRKLGIVQR